MKRYGWQRVSVVWTVDTIAFVLPQLGLYILPFVTTTGDGKEREAYLCFINVYIYFLDFLFLN